MPDLDRAAGRGGRRLEPLERLAARRRSPTTCSSSTRAMRSSGAPASARFSRTASASRSCPRARRAAGDQVGAVGVGAGDPLGDGQGLVPPAQHRQLRDQVVGGRQEARVEVEGAGEEGGGGLRVPRRDGAGRPRGRAPPNPAETARRRGHRWPAPFQGDPAAPPARRGPAAAPSPAAGGPRAPPHPGRADAAPAARPRSRPGTRCPGRPARGPGRRRWPARTRRWPRRSALDSGAGRP